MPLLRREKPLSAREELFNNQGAITGELPRDKYAFKQGRLNSDVQREIEILKRAREGRYTSGMLSGTFLAAVPVFAVAKGAADLRAFGSVIAAGGATHFVSDARTENARVKEATARIGELMRKGDFLNPSGLNGKLADHETQLQKELRDRYAFVFVKKNGNLMFTNKAVGLKLFGQHFGRKREAVR
jgi:hypothetical protein